MIDLIRQNQDLKNEMLELDREIYNYKVFLHIYLEPYRIKNQKMIIYIIWVINKSNNQFQIYGILIVFKKASPPNNMKNFKNKVLKLFVKMLYQYLNKLFIKINYNHIKRTYETFYNK